MMTTVSPHGNGRSRSLRRLLVVCAIAHSLTQALTHVSTLGAQTPPAIARSPTDSAFVIRALAEIRERAVAEHPLGEIARSNRERAIARANATGQAAPLTFSAGLSEAPIGAVDQGNLRAEIGRDFRTGSRRRAERELANVDVNLADLEIAIAARDAATDAFQSTITAAVLARISARLTAEDVMLSGAEETVRARFSTGDARYVDVLRLRTERLHVQSDRSASLADERLSRAMLTSLVNASNRVRTSSVVDSLAATPLEELWRLILPDLTGGRVIDSLLTLTASEQELAIAETRSAAERQLLLAEQRSTVNGYAGVQRIGQANNGATFGPSFGFTMTLPFTATRANTLALQAADVSLTSMRATRRVTRETMRATLAAGLEHYMAERARLETFDAALLRGAQEERESAIASYRTGELSLTELLDFERAISRAEIERLRALMDAVQALTELTHDADGTEPSQHRARSER